MATATSGATTIKLLYIASLICSALLCGLTLSHVLQAPGSRGLTGPEWLSVQHTFYGGFALVGGVAEVAGLITTGILATFYFSRRRIASAVAPLVAAVCLLGTLLAFWFGNRPVNARVATWTSDNLPSDWSTYRDIWENAHAASAILASIAFLILAITLVWPRAEATRDT